MRIRTQQLTAYNVSGHRAPYEPKVPDHLQNVEPMYRDGGYSYYGSNYGFDSDRVMEYYPNPIGGCTIMLVRGKDTVSRHIAMSFEDLDAALQEADRKSRILEITATKG